MNSAMNSSDPSSPPQTPPSESAPETKDAIGPEGPSPLEPYFLRTSNVIAAALLALAFLLLSHRPLWHSDVWGHLKFGQWIVQHRQLPAQEPFSPFTDRQPYIHFQWLSQVSMYLVFACGEWLAGGDQLHRLAGGVEMLALLFMSLGFLRWLFLLLAYRRISASMPLACVGLFLVQSVGLIYGNMQRPQMAGDVLFAALLLALSPPTPPLNGGGRGGLSRQSMLLLPISFVLWANLHGSYAVGLALLGVFLLGRIITVGRAAGSWDPKGIVTDSQVRRLFLVGLASTAAIALLNPHGPWLFLHTLAFAQGPNIASMGEWQPLSFQWEMGPQWGYGLLCVVVIATQILSPRLLSPTSLLLCAVFGVFPLFQQRMLSWWIVLVPWIVLPEWAELGRRINWSWLHYRSQPSGAKTLMAAILLLLAFWVAPPLKWLCGKPARPLEGSLSPGTPWKLAKQLSSPSSDKPYYPELADALKRGYPQGRFHGRIFASPTLGDYLLWDLPSDYPVLVFTHAQLFPPDHWQDCVTVLTAELGWQEILDRYGVNLIVVEVEMHPQLAEALKADANWRIVVDETGLRRKNDPRTRLLIAVRKAPLAN